MVKTGLVVCCLFLCSFVVLAQEALATPADTRAMTVSASALATLREAIQSAEAVLRFHPWASEHSLSAEDWTSADFAAYATGILRSESYDITVVESSASWQGSPTHTWLLVRVSTSDGDLWFPIEPSPSGGETQLHLGRIPTASNHGLDLWFEPLYSSFDHILSDIPNQLLVVSLRPVVPAPEPEENVRIFAHTTIGPNSEIVLYWWDFGDGTASSPGCCCGTCLDRRVA